MGYWKETDKHVYGAIYREHKKELTVFGTYSNPEGSHEDPQCQMMTEWGFMDATFPLIKSTHKWEIGTIGRVDEWKFWIYVNVREDED